MSAVDFLDSNLFIYLLDGSDERKRQRALELVQDSLENGTGCISYQVVQETMNILLRKVGVSTEEAHTFFNTVLAPLWTVNPTPDFYRRGLDIQARYQFSFYDSLIVVAALGASCHTLYSEDLQNGQRIEKLTITNPFLE